MENRYDVLGVGISAVDDLFYVPSYPFANCKIPVTGTVRRGGGPVSTAMAAIGLLEGDAAFVGRLGRDDLSGYVMAELRHRKVDTAHVIEDPHSGPYHCVIIIDEAGSRTVFYDSSKYAPIRPQDIADQLLNSSQMLLLDYLSDPPAIELAKKARSLSLPVVGDIEGHSDGALDLAAFVDHLIVPEDFAVWATGESNARDACAALAKVTRAATIVTSGAKGSHCLLAGSGVPVHFPAFEIEAFDTTGCGDVFHGAYALAIARQVPTVAAITFASAASALKANASHGRKHGWDALPELESVLELLRERLNGDQKSRLFAALESLGPKRKFIESKG